MCHVYIFFGSSLGKVYLCQVSLLQDMCDRFYGGGFSALPHNPWTAPKRPNLNRVKSPKTIIRMCFIEIITKKISKILRKTPVLESFFNTVATLVKRESKTLVLSCEFAKILRTVFFHRTLAAAASIILFKNNK